MQETPSIIECSKVADSFGSFIFSLTRPRAAPALSQHFATMLPPRPRAQILFDYYLNSINWIYHIIHVPTVKEHFEEIYTGLEQGKQPKYDRLALISTLFALSAYFSAPSAKLFTDTSEAMVNCRRWTLLAQDALSAADCLSKPTIESLQSLILIAQHLMPNIGAVATLRTLSGTITHAARTLALHQVDSIANKKRREGTQVDWAEIEVKRRLWWHIVSTDWYKVPLTIQRSAANMIRILSFMSGSQCGTYMIQPQQMNCDWPTNVDDERITADGNYAQPLTTLTEMTYFILRIRFSVIFRSIVDAAWEAGSDLDDLPYDIVLECDKRLNSLLAELESSFRDISKNKSRDPTFAASTERKFSLLSRQRDMGLFGIHTRISRLHRAYLIRGAQDPRYAYSRMVCLRSARTVIEIGKQMTESQKTIPHLVSIKIWTLNHHIFVSTVVLVMDYCFNRDEPRAKERKDEILECFRLLGEGKDENTIATRGLRMLREMLKRTPDGGEGSRPMSGSGSPNGSAAAARSAPLPPSSKSIGPTPLAMFPTFPPTQHLAQENVAQPQPSPAFGPTGFEDPPPYQWANWENSFDDFNFGVNLDPSQFEALFQFEERTEMF